MSVGFGICVDLFFKVRFGFNASASLRYRVIYRHFMTYCLYSVSYQKGRWKIHIDTSN